MKPLSGLDALFLYAETASTPMNVIATVVVDGGDFVATAAYGSPLADEVWILRELRDVYLLRNQVGKIIVSLYYRYSPALARRISGNQMTRKAARIGLYPIVTLSKCLLDL